MIREAFMSLPGRFSIARLPFARRLGKLSFARISIARKLVLAFATLIVIVVSVLGINVRNLTLLEGTVQEAGRTQQILHNMNGILVAITEQENGVRGYLLSSQRDYLMPYRNAGKKVDELVAATRELVADNPRQVARIDEIKDMNDQWRRTIADPQIEMANDAARAEEARLTVAQGLGRALMFGLRDVTAEVMEAEERLLNTRRQAQQEAFSLSELVSAIGFGLTIVLGCGSAFALYRGIVVPVASLTRIMTKLADDDTSVTVPGLGRGDEIGSMASAVQVFKANAIERQQLEAEKASLEATARAEKKQAMETLAGHFEEKVGSLVRQLSLAAQEMESTARSMSSNAEQTNQQSNMVAAAAEQTSANVQAVATATEELSVSASEIGSQVTQSSNIASRAVGEARRTNEKVQGLAEGAGKIGAVVKLISDIAAQTNLLALNATIEAARAGEAGRGFAVVASEVKELASQTSRATEDIASQISEIQNFTTEMVEAMQSIGATIEDMSRIASSVAEAVEQQQAATGEIARNVNEAARGTQDVTENISQVREAATQTGVSASQVLSAAGGLAGDADALTREVREFLSGIRAA
jgi:methyl-accepting chemotaxis protein